MFGLLESCILNKVNFGEYIEDVLTRILFGEEGDESFFVARRLMPRSCHVTMFAVMKMARMLSSLSMPPKVKE